MREAKVGSGDALMRLEGHWPVASPFYTEALMHFTWGQRGVMNFEALIETRGQPLMKIYLIMAAVQH